MLFRSVCNLFIPALAHCALQRRIAFAGGDARDIDDTVERGDEEVPVRALVTEGDLRLPLCPTPHAGEDAAQVIQDSGVCPCAPAFIVARVCVIELVITTKVRAARKIYTARLLSGAIFLSSVVAVEP